MGKSIIPQPLRRPRHTTLRQTSLCNWMNVGDDPVARSRCTALVRGSLGSLRKQPLFQWLSGWWF